MLSFLSIFFFAIAIGLTIYFVIKITNSSSNTKLSEKNLKEISGSNISQGVIVLMEYNPMQFILKGIKPKIEINSRPYDVKWGANKIDLDSGEYNLNCFFPYMGMDKCCEGSIDFILKENEVIKMKYTVPLTIGQKGSLRILTE